MSGRAEPLRVVIPGNEQQQHQCWECSPEDQGSALAQMFRENAPRNASGLPRNLREHDQAAENRTQELS
jgi:hypothetical protein